MKLTAVRPRMEVAGDGENRDVTTHLEVIFNLCIECFVRRRVGNENDGLIRASRLIQFETFLDPSVINFLTLDVRTSIRVVETEYCYLIIVKEPYLWITVLTGNGRQFTSRLRKACTELIERRIFPREVVTP